MSTLYENIKQLCDSHNVKPSRMAIDAGISKSIISGLKNGTKSFISLEVAQKIADYFDTTVDVVLNGTMQGNVEHELRGYREGVADERTRINETPVPTTENGLDERKQRVISLLDKLSEEQQDLIIARLEDAVRSLKALDAPLESD